MTKKRKIERGDPIFIEWIDSRSFSGWEGVRQTDENSLDSLTCHSTGFLFREHKDRVSIIQSRGVSLDGNFESVNALITIPRVAIKSMRKLK